MSLNPLELLGLLPRPALKGRTRVRNVEGEERVRRRRTSPQRKPTPEQKRAIDRRYIEKNGERARQLRRAASKRRYWRDVAKSREYYRKRQAGKQRKENYTPEQWRWILERQRAAKHAREAADPSIRERRLAKARAYYYANKQKGKT